METTGLEEELGRARQRFLELVAELRPELHRYCSRLTGSVIDGEDIVQDTLAKAFFALGSMKEFPPLRPLLFRIAHNSALDTLRRYEHRNVEPMAEVPDTAFAAGSSDPETVRAALAEFLRLPVPQRSAVILKDVLGATLEELADATGTSVEAAKAALFRGRTALREARNEEAAPEPRRVSPEERAKLQHYAELFNRRDWEGLRALLADDCRLDLVSYHQRRGKSVGEYFSRYAELRDLRVVAGMFEGRPALAMFSPRDAREPSNFVFLEWRAERLALIRDYRYVPYVASEAGAFGVRFLPDTADSP